MASILSRPQCVRISRCDHQQFFLKEITHTIAHIYFFFQQNQNTFFIEAQTGTIVNTISQQQVLFYYSNFTGEIFILLQGDLIILPQALICWRFLVEVSFGFLVFSLPTDVCLRLCVNTPESIRMIIKLSRHFLTSNWSRYIIAMKELHLPGLLSRLLHRLHPLCTIWTVSWAWLFYSLNPLHAYWSRHPMVFRCLTSLFL